MKCPKCGYLGFETTDRCRNCQYDFSLSPASPDPDLTLRSAGDAESNADFELRPMARQVDSLNPAALDLDRLFGDPAPAPLASPRPEPPPESASRLASRVDAGSRHVVAAEAPSDSWVTPATEAVAPIDEAAFGGEPAADPTALPFDDAPLLPPRAARTPLAVRRATPEIPRNRPRTTRPVRIEPPLAFDPAPAAAATAGGPSASATVAALMEAPALAVRVGAGVIDLALLAGIDAVVLFLTLRIAGLQTTMEDLRVLPAVPFAGFLVVLAFGYVASFTVAGGQTIGKMVLKLRVIGDDGRPVDAAGGVLRAVGCMLVPITLGLSYVPALFSSDHRALHDRLAGTRVVCE